VCEVAREQRASCGVVCGREGRQDGRSEVWRHTTYFTARAELSPRAADATEKSSDMVAVALWRPLS